MIIQLMMHYLCIAQKSTINNSQRNTSNENIYFKSNEEMYSNFEDIPEIIQNNLNISYLVIIFLNQQNHNYLNLKMI